MANKTIIQALLQDTRCLGSAVSSLLLIQTLVGFSFPVSTAARQEQLFPLSVVDTNQQSIQVSASAALVAQATYSEPVFVAAEQVSAQDSFSSALRLAIQQNPESLVTQAKIVEQRLLVEAAKAQWLPSGSVQAYAQTNTLPLSFSLQQPVYTFGRLGSTINKAKENELLVDAQALRTKRELIERTALAYVRVLTAKRRLQIQASYLSSLEKLRNQIRNRLNAEVAAKADLNLVETRLTQADSKAQQIIQELQNATTDLASLATTAASSQDDIPRKFLELPNQDKLEEQLYTNSIELLEADQQIKLATSDYAVAKTKSLPTIFANVEQLADLASGTTRDVNYGFSIGTGVRGMGFQDAREVSAAKQQIEVSKLQRQAIYVGVKRSTQRLISQHKTLGVIADANRESIVQLSRLVVSYQNQYTAGFRSWLDLLNLYRELNDSRLELANTESDLTIAALQLNIRAGLLDDVAGITSIFQQSLLQPGQKK